MKRIRDATLPRSPALYADERTGEVVVIAKYPTLYRKAVIKMVFIFGTLAFLLAWCSSGGQVVTENDGAKDFIIGSVTWLFGGTMLAYFCVWLFRKKTKVTFTEDAVIIKNWFPKRHQRIDDIHFRFLPHEDVSANFNMERMEKHRLTNYGHVVMEYGQRTVSIGKVANLKIADNFTRVLSFGLILSGQLATARAQAPAPVRKKPRKPEKAPIDDELPE